MILAVSFTGMSFIFLLALMSLTLSSVVFAVTGDRRSRESCADDALLSTTNRISRLCHG